MPAGRVAQNEALLSRNRRRRPPGRRRACLDWAVPGARPAGRSRDDEERDVDDIPDGRATGEWPEVAARMQATYLRSTWRPFRVADIVDESATIRSLHLQPTDGIGLIANRPGQHLPIRVSIAGAREAACRDCALSSAPSDPVYRISVRRGDPVSDHLHGLQIGDAVEAHGPAGTFVMDTSSRRPAMLIAAGVGIAPMMAMLRGIVHDGLPTRRFRPTRLVYAARSLAARAFDAEIDLLMAVTGGAVRLTRVLSDPSSAAPADFELRGRIDREVLADWVPDGECDFFVCGPPAFMRVVHDGLVDLRVPGDRILVDSFGPSASRRRPMAAVGGLEAARAWRVDEQSKA